MLKISKLTDVQNLVSLAQLKLLLLLLHVSGNRGQPHQASSPTQKAKNRGVFVFNILTKYKSSSQTSRILFIVNYEFSPRYVQCLFFCTATFLKINCIELVKPPAALTLTTKCLS